VQEIRSYRTNYTIRRDTKLDCGRNTSKVRVSYLLLVRKLDMEIPPDSLQDGGVNELSVVTAVDESVTTTQTVSSSFGTHRERSSKSNTEFMSIISAVNSGAVSSIVLKRGSSIDPIHIVYLFMFLSIVPKTKDELLQKWQCVRNDTGVDKNWGPDSICRCLRNKECVADKDYTNVEEE
jgi:hypothetical protein